MHVTDDRARKKAIRARMATTGEPYSVAARAVDAAAAAGPAPRTATATVTLDGQRWRITTSDGSYPERRGGPTSWGDGVALTDRARFLKHVGRELTVHGWDIAGDVAGADLPDPVPPAVELALVRNERGRNLDEAERLHREAGVDYHSAHDAYIDAVAAAVAATGMTIHDITADGGEPREGWFALGEDPDEDGEPLDGPVPADLIVWRDETGWYHLHYRDRHAVHGDGPYALPGLYGLTPPPHEVAAAVLRAFPVDGAAEPQPWPVPAGYDPAPPPAPDDGWSVSAALERSLTAYVKPRAS
jgi:hypothetical protein